MTTLVTAASMLLAACSWIVSGGPLLSPTSNGTFKRVTSASYIRQLASVFPPPSFIIEPAPLFHKVYIDTMFMPPASGYHYLVQAHCLLTAWPEWRALRAETGHTVGAFIFKEILCHWGAVSEIVTDNGSAYMAALDWLADKYGIRHIQILAYNSRANGIVE